MTKQERENKSQWLQVALTPDEMERVDSEVRRQQYNRRGVTRSSLCAELILEGLDRM